MRFVGWMFLALGGWIGYGAQLWALPRVGLDALHAGEYVIACAFSLGAAAAIEVGSILVGIKDNRW